jgi:hypothetical protein
MHVHMKEEVGSLRMQAELQGCRSMHEVCLYVVSGQQLS